jgi:hypothetical protein
MKTMSPEAGKKNRHGNRDEIYNFAAGGTLVSIFPQKLAILQTLGYHWRPGRS